jgi:hypothetical protein
MAPCNAMAGKGAEKVDSVARVKMGPSWWGRLRFRLEASLVMVDHWQGRGAGTSEASGGAGTRCKALEGHSHSSSVHVEAVRPTSSAWTVLPQVIPSLELPSVRDSVSLRNYSAYIQVSCPRLPCCPACH